MVTEFVDEVRRCFKGYGFGVEGSTDKGIGAGDRGGDFLIGYEGRLFYLMEDYQIAEVRHGYNACGCGDFFALGSLYSTEGILKPKERILIALGAAQEFSAGVGKPFTIVKLEGE